MYTHVHIERCVHFSNKLVVCDVVFLCHTFFMFTFCELKCSLIYLSMQLHFMWTSVYFLLQWLQCITMVCPVLWASIFHFRGSSLCKVYIFGLTWLSIHTIFTWKQSTVCCVPYVLIIYVIKKKNAYFFFISIFCLRISAFLFLG